jgi:hypothetical protein
MERPVQINLRREAPSQTRRFDLTPKRLQSRRPTRGLAILKAELYGRISEIEEKKHEFDDFDYRFHGTIESIVCDR